MPPYKWQVDDTLVVRLAAEHTATTDLREKLKREFRVDISQMAIDDPADRFTTLTFRRYANKADPWFGKDKDAKGRYQRHMALVICSVLRKIGLSLAA